MIFIFFITGEAVFAENVILVAENGWLHVGDIFYVDFIFVVN